MIAGPGDSRAAAEGRGDGHLGTSHADPDYREQAIRTLRASLVQGRLTEGEYDARMSQVSTSRFRAELDALTADLPVGRIDAPARPPTARDVRIAVSAIIAAASVVAVVLLWQPDNALAFMAFLFAAVTLLVAPIVTVGMMVDVRRQKRSGGQLPPGPAPHPGEVP